LNFVLCISVDLIVNVRQIIAVASILSVSKNEHLHAPLFEWLLAYTIGAISIGIAITKREPTNQDSSKRVISDPNTNIAPYFHASEFMDSANSTGMSGSNPPIACPR
jgi:hypothetical protein